jgi:hypothetical protein
MPSVIILLLFAPLFAQDSPLKAYLELSGAQIQQMNRVARAGIDRPSPAPLIAAVNLLTETQKAKLPALEEAARIQLARLGAISFHLIDARQETISCWCTAEDALVKYLGLTDEQRGELRRLEPNERLAALTPERLAKLDGLRIRGPLVDLADEAAGLRLISETIPRGECLCP